MEPVVAAECVFNQRLPDQPIRKMFFSFGAFNKLTLRQFI